jgi:D-sedoheptulose 7-phosphate isomerase
MSVDPEIENYLAETAEIATLLDRGQIARVLQILRDLKEGDGRLFCLGVGGSAANASHAVCDFRKLAGIEAYTPSDNAAELTARTNDDGWGSTYAEWLAGSRLRPSDVVMVLSVGGGSIDPVISVNIVRALDYAKGVGARIIGIVGRREGHAAAVADACIVVPTVNPARITPHAEVFQIVMLHLLVMHSGLRQAMPKWEGAM